MPITREYSSFLASFGSSKFQGLWSAQAHVLDAYGTTYATASDVAITADWSRQDTHRRDEVQ